MICIYHSRDLDGWMSAAIVKLWHEKEKVDGELELIGWDYGQPLPILSAEKHEELVMVDISFPMPTMESLLDPFNVTWIDHHKSALDERRQYFTNNNPFKGLQFSDYAACELTWMHFFDGEKMPDLVRLLGRYDCFGHKGTEEELKVLEFQYGARQAISNPQEAYQMLIIARGRGDWSFDADVCEEIHLQGEAIYKYLCAEAKQIYARKFEMKWGDKIIAMVNQERFNPVNFGIDYHKDGYDAFGCFHFVKGKWMFSLYNDNGDVDVSELCKQQGGGGHKGAAGFVKEDISWLFQYTTSLK